MFFEVEGKRGKKRSARTKRARARGEKEGEALLFPAEGEKKREKRGKC